MGEQILKTYNKLKQMAKENEIELEIEQIPEIPRVSNKINHVIGLQREYTGQEGYVIKVIKSR